MDIPPGALERNYSIQGSDGKAGLISPQGKSRNCKTAQLQVCPCMPTLLTLAGGDALPKLVNRTIEVDEKQWLALHRNLQSTTGPDISEKPGKIPKVGSHLRSAQLYRITGRMPRVMGSSVQGARITAMPAGELSFGTEVCLLSTHTLKHMPGGAPICCSWMLHTLHLWCLLVSLSTHQVPSGTG